MEWCLNNTCQFGWRKWSISHLEQISGSNPCTTDNIDKPGCHEIEKTRPVVPMSVNPGKIELNSFGIQRQVDATHWLSGVFLQTFVFSYSWEIKLYHLQLLNNYNYILSHALSLKFWRLSSFSDGTMLCWAQLAAFSSERKTAMEFLRGADSTEGQQGVTLWVR